MERTCRQLAPRAFRLIEHDRDRYGRIVGEVFDEDGSSLNLAMVAAGQAAVYPDYCPEGRFYRAQRQAQAAELVIWAKPVLTLGRHRSVDPAAEDGARVRVPV